MAIQPVKNIKTAAGTTYKLDLVARREAFEKSLHKTRLSPQERMDSSPSGRIARGLAKFLDTFIEPLL